MVLMVVFFVVVVIVVVVVVFGSVVTVLIFNVLVEGLTVRSSSTTSTIFLKLIFRQSHKARQGQRKKTDYKIFILGPS